MESYNSTSPAGSQTHSDITEQPVVVVIDILHLRRAELVAFLQNWKTSAGVVVFDAPDISEELPLSTLRMALLNIGGTSVVESGLPALFGKFAVLQPEPAIVVISDNRAADEVVSAFKAGARGYIPTSMEPALALEALTLILNGGDYFPPAALLERHRRRLHGRSRIRSIISRTDA